MRYLKAVAVAATASAGIALPATSAARSNAAPRQHCHRTFTLPMFKRAARATYTGTRLPRKGAYGRLWVYARCQRRSANTRRARVFWGAEWRAWAGRREAAAHPFSTAYVSWYDDAGSTASGWHATYGVADCGSGGGPCYAFGTKIEFCLNGCVVATVDDHGPYVAGREFDLNQNTAGAIGFSGVGDVQWRLAQ